MNVMTILVLGVRISVFLTIVGLGMHARPSDITHLFRRPGQLIRALTSMYVIMPLFAILLVKLCSLNPVIEIVLVALSVSPVPPLFPKAALKSGGDASFTFGLLAALTFLSIIVIPLAFAIVDAVFAHESQFSLFWLIKMILMQLVLAMAIGMTLRHFAPAFSERYADLIVKLAGILLLASFLPILIAILPVMWSLIGGRTLLALVLFALAGAATGYFLGGPDPKERDVLALATASRHPGIAVFLTSVSASASAGDIPKQTIAAAVILYLIASTIVVAPFLKWLSRDRTGDRVVESIR